jgi:hypothetical protein
MTHIILVEDLGGIHIVAHCIIIIDSRFDKPLILPR